jgi:hypothetical protein
MVRAGATRREAAEVFSLAGSTAVAASLMNLPLSPCRRLVRANDSRGQWPRACHLTPPWRPCVSPCTRPRRRGRVTVAAKPSPHSSASIAWHFRGRIDCRIRCRLSEWLGRFKGRITRGSCIGLFGGSRSGGAIGSWSGFVGLPGFANITHFSSSLPDAERAGSHKTDLLLPQIQRFLFTASAALFAASFTAAFALPVDF